MKNLTLLMLCFAFGQFLQAQEDSETRKFVSGGYINFNVQNNSQPASGNSFAGYNDNKYFSFGFNPYIGRQLNKHFLAGIDLLYGIRNSDYGETTIIGQVGTVDLERKVNEYGVGLFGRYGFTPDKAFNFYLQPALSYNMIQSKEIQDAQVVWDNQTNIFELNIGAGLLYDINERLRATIRTGGLYYNIGNSKTDGSESKQHFDSFGLNLNLSNIYFGVEVRI
ncbi:MAG: hypothetical protein R3A50_11355 [Saprospiraceae bacterium]